MMRRSPMARTGFKPNSDVPAPKKAAKPKTRLCAVCKITFEKIKQLQKVCSPICAQKHAESLSAKKQRQAMRADLVVDRAKREAMKSYSELRGEAQTAFNAFIRFRDLIAGHGCIDCGKPFEPQRPGGSIDAGHYLSRGSAGHLRFDERNCFAQRKNCNRPGGTTREAFRAGVEKRIGREALEALESDQTIQKWTHDDLRAIRRLYQKKLKDLRAARSE